MLSRFLRARRPTVNRSAPAGWCSALVLAIASGVAFALGSVIAAGTAAAGELRTYRGELRPSMSETDAAAINFTLIALIGDQRAESYWTIDQSGMRGWEWVDRVGRLPVDGTAASGPALRYDDGDVHGVVPILLSIPAPQQPWTVGSTWDDGPLHHEVVAIQGEGADARVRIQVRTNFGDKRTVELESGSGHIRQAQETVFLGQGQRFVLQYSLAEQQALPPPQQQQAVSDFTRLVELRDQLQLSPQQAPRQWSEAQLTQLRESLPALAEQVQTVAVTNVLKKAVEEARAERTRAGAIEALRRKALAGKLPDFQLDPVAGATVQRKDLDNAVTVIHFWDYQDAPLREPYGQVGYLDYLFRKYEGQGVRVLGVVVNQQTESAALRRNGVLSARRFANFMNLAYPLYVDDGSLLRALGDPRTAEATLPLFVAVNKQGQVVHYYSGHYPVESNKGLVELEEVIKQALQMAE